MSAVPDQTVSRLLRVVSPRHRRNWLLLVRFGLVGASGVLVNLVVLYTLQVVGPTYSGIWIDLPGTDFNVRWYHLFVTVAFLTANLWNFQLNRRWTFRSVGHGSTWWSEYLPFLVIGLLALGLNLGLVTLMIHPHSPLSLSSDALRRQLAAALETDLGQPGRGGAGDAGLVRPQQALDLPFGADGPTVPGE